MPLIGLAIAGAAVATSYLIPLIITCGAAVVAMVGAFFVGKKVAEKKEPSGLKELQKQQLERDQKTRRQAEKSALKTGHEVKQILTQSKKQQQQLSNSIQQFDKNIDDASQATVNLEHVAQCIQDVANSSVISVESLSQELERLKQELILVNQVLRSSQEGLHEKEKLLADTINQLTLTEQKIAAESTENTKKIQQLQDELTFLQHTLKHANQETPLKEKEMEKLRFENERLTATIIALETTIKGLTAKLADSDKENTSQFQDIQRLLQENKHLIKAIDELSNTFNQQFPHSSNNQEVKANTLRLFK